MATKKLAARVITGLIPSIKIRVMNKLTSNFEKSWSINVESKQTLFDGMINLEKNDPTFSFASERHPEFGQHVISICQMVACDAANNHWQIFGTDKKRLPKGVSQTYPIDGDSYLFDLTILK